MRQSILLILIFLITCVANAQNTNGSAATIRKQMATIRQSTNWDDPAAAKKANEEIQKLAKQLTGGNSLQIQLNNQPPDPNAKPKNVDFEVKSAVTQENIVAIANRFFNRSYRTLTGVPKITFDKDFKAAEKADFSLESVRKLTSTGAVLITFGNDHHLACVYLAAALKAIPTDTLSINNFGGYLRAIDSTKISIPVLLFANSLYAESPVIHTQLGNSYQELGDLTKAESQYKEALKYDPGFGQAHTALCDLYIKQGRIEDAIKELFAGVKGMGCSYKDASGKFASLEQQYGKGPGKDDAQSKEAFWKEIKNNVSPSGNSPSPSPGVGKVKMPVFPDCGKVEDWLEGGGYNNAVMAYKDFFNDMMSFNKQFQQVNNQLPMISPGATLRDYPNERFALDCITEMFRNLSNQESQKYNKSMDEISQRVDDAKELYLKNFSVYAKALSSCIGSCGNNDKCFKECHRQYCLKECPNANNFNSLLRQAYNDYRLAFSQQTSKQIQLLDDLYAFSDPWLAKLYSAYWSKIYAFEVKSVALGIVGNCYADYPQAFQFPAHNDCGTDCSPFAIPFTEDPDDVNKDDPEGNSCDENTTFKISLLICELGLDCESVEFGCSALVAASVKRNYKRDNTTLFIGVGMEGSLGKVSAGAKAGATITVGDHDGVQDVGLQADVSVSKGMGFSKIGTTSSATCTVMTGLKTNSTLDGGIGF